MATTCSQIQDGDVIIPVFGLSGSGRSTFIDRLLRETETNRPKIGDGDSLEPITRICTPYVVDSGRVGPNVDYAKLPGRFVLVDTPGLDNLTSAADNVITKFLNALSSKRKVQFGGAIFMAPITIDRIPPLVIPAMKSLYQMNQYPCLALVTTRWNDSEDSKKQERRESQMSGMLQPIACLNVLSLRLGNDRESAWGTIDVIVKKTYEPASINQVRTEAPSSSGREASRAGVIGNDRLHIMGQFHFDRATGFRKLHGKAYQLVDNELLAALGQMFIQFMKGVEKVELEENGGWDSIMEALTQSPFFAKDDDMKGVVKTFVTNRTQVIRGFANFWQSRSQMLQKHIADTREMTIQDAEIWFEEELVDDVEIRESIKLDIKTVAHEQEKTVVDLIWANAEEGIRHAILSGIQPSEDINQGCDKHEKRFLDIGVLRLPDFQEPYIKVYRIQLTAWTKITFKSWRIESGIKGGGFLDICTSRSSLKRFAIQEYNHCRFRPRTAFLNTFSPEVLKIARETAIDYLLEGKSKSNSPSVGDSSAPVY